MLPAERQGLGRVLEALQAHMWPGLQMKPPNSGGVAALSSAAADGSSEQPQLPGDTDSLQARAAPPDAAAPADAARPPAEPPAGPHADDAFGAFLGAGATDPDDDADRKFAQLMGRLSGVTHKCPGLFFQCHFWSGKAAPAAAC